MPFERESFVPVCTSPTFVCTSKGSEIQRVSVFARPLYSELSQFSRYRNGIKGSGDTAISKFHKCVKSGSRSFLKISKWDQQHSKENLLYPFVPLLLSFVLQKVRRHSDFKISKMRQEGKSIIFKDIEMEPTAKGEIETDTNDSLSNAINLISISWKLAKSVL